MGKIINGLFSITSLVLFFFVYDIFGIWTIIGTSILSGILVGISNSISSRQELDNEIIYNPREFPQFIGIAGSIGIAVLLYNVIDFTTISDKDLYLAIAYLLTATGLPMSIALITLIRDRNDFISIKGNTIKYKDNKNIGEFSITFLKEAKADSGNILLYLIDEKKEVIKTSQMNFKPKDLNNAIKDINLKIDPKFYDKTENETKINEESKINAEKTENTSIILDNEKKVETKEFTTFDAIKSILSLVALVVIVFALFLFENPVDKKQPNTSYNRVKKYQTTKQIHSSKEILKFKKSDDFIAWVNTNTFTITNIDNTSFGYDSKISNKLIFIENFSIDNYNEEYKTLVSIEYDRPWIHEDDNAILYGNKLKIYQNFQKISILGFFRGESTIASGLGYNDTYILDGVQVYENGVVVNAK